MLHKLKQGDRLKILPFIINGKIQHFINNKFYHFPDDFITPTNLNPFDKKIRIISKFYVNAYITNIDRKINIDSFILCSKRSKK